MQDLSRALRAESAICTPETDRKQNARRHLGSECLGAGHTNLRTRVGQDHVVRFAHLTGSLNVADRQHTGAQFAA